MSQNKSAIQEKLIKTVEKNLLKALEDKEEELDREIEILKNDDELDRIREKRIQELKNKAVLNQKLKGLGHGSYKEIHEKDLFEVTKESYYTIVHYYRPSTTRCQILDVHLNKLAHVHIETRFVKINAEKSEFTASRFNIKYIPTLVFIKNRKVVAKLIGFEEFGNSDDFSTETVEKVLKSYEVLGMPIPSKNDIED